MKKLVIGIIVATLLLTSFPNLTYAAGPTPGSSEQWPGSYVSDGMIEAAPFEFEFQPVSDQWLSLIGGEPPAVFNKVSYQLADNVVEVNKTVTDNIASAGQLIAGSAQQKLTPNRIIAEGGYIPMPVLEAAAGQSIKNGTVMVDITTGTAFKVVSPAVFGGVFDVDEDLKNTVKPLEGNYSVTRPSLHEVIKDFTLEEETIHLTRGNISGFARNIEKNMVIPGIFRNMAFKDSLTDFKELSDDPLINLQFTNEELDARLGDGSPISVTVSGGLGIDNVDLVGKYTGFDGYRIAMTLKQESYLIVTLDATVDDEIRIPILGINVPFGIGSVTGGIFAIVGMDGTLRLEIAVRESTSTTVGVRGSTKFYVPTSVHPVFGQEFRSDGDVDLAGNIDGYLKFGPMLGIEIFGFDLVGAGVFLGAGVKVETEEKSLNVELYGIFNVYVKMAGEHFNLANYKPTILRRKQADTAGYRIKIMEAYLKPGRVGGTIQQEVDDESDADGYGPASDIPYRILVVPAGESFNPDNPHDVDKPLIRKYPSAGYAFTNQEGEFIQKDEDILFAYDRVYLEFQVEGESYFSDPVTASFPFENIILTSADYFNDFTTGHVQPVKVINWEASAGDPPEDQFEWAYYDHGLLHVDTYQTDPDLGDVYGGQACTRTDAYGNFDTRVPPTVINGIIPVVPNTQHFDIRPTYQPEHDFSWRWAIFDLTISDHGAQLTKRISTFHPTMSLSFSRVIEAVEGSYKRNLEGDKIIDQMQFDEYIWIENPLGTRTVTQDEFDYSMWSFSTQDYFYRTDDSKLSANLAAFTGEDKWNTPPIIQTQPDTQTLTPVLDENGNPTGTAQYSQRVTVQWVWQPHPNPVRITSADHTQTTTNGGTFQVTASGFAPFTYTLKDAPQGVEINKNTGMITIPANMTEKDYAFTIHVEEALIIAPSQIAFPGWSDPRMGHDPSPPAEQLFTLKIIKAPAEIETPAPTPAETPDPGPGSTPEPEIVPTVVPTPTPTPTPSPTPTSPTHGGDTPPAPSPTPTRTIIPRPTDLPPLRLLSLNGKNSEVPVNASGVQLVSMQAAGNGNLPFETDLAASLSTPPNSVTILCNHALDVYTRDRFTTNGATYIKWDSLVKISVEGSGISYSGVDQSPLCDQYHYYKHINIPETVKDDVIQSFSKLLSDYQRDDIFLGERLNNQAMLQEFNNYVVNPLGDSVFYLEYGSLLDSMDRENGGSFLVDLNNLTGTMVTGKYFDALQNHKKATISFRQKGAVIAFAGKDIQTASELDLFNFAYTDKAPHAEAMLSGIDAGAENFSFGFAHHGALPGMATFSISTNLKPGTKVNVYKFEAASGRFTLIAGDKIVGNEGVVTYQNNTMSEYLITTSTISGAAISDMVNLQIISPWNGWWLIVIGIAAVIVCIAAWVFWKKRSGRRFDSEKQEG